jgi:hypothetical protein
MIKGVRPNYVANTLEVWLLIYTEVVNYRAFKFGMGSEQDDRMTKISLLSIIRFQVRTA